MPESKRASRSADGIRAIVRGFESCTLLPDDFDHQAHLIVALSYLVNSNVPDASDKMRRGLHRFLKHHGVSQEKYNETITIFWLKRVQSFLKQTGASLSLASLANSLIADCDNPRLIFDYYSQERLASDEARESWQVPDVKLLDF